ncbi:hypothetical protein A2955_01440 [Candidatus Woesebacteria bacterium RIFCSPLOWO2_01_FULL_37_19]|uniref:DUF262 domain-containing protein n=2 Tax=Candidatus Woeseibacteriota TaxID=1752722 RepID=A0A1F8B9F3_9BACT|nr:MAG: hypothetical protein A2771_00260 [Candidatus Woesebacteria bacterium RIFCSPHIGHO2_01_FULL_38_26b]OGM60015.1 MAG: hypothetical protein A2955_01440 [Candidatus Woesebacteria bacterium RIFCSPLOWO2_01_FULL_37_19]
MKITPTTLTITQLLSNESEQFVVPAYQRRYSWHSKHIAELFDDINLLEKGGETHLLGSIVCLTSSHGVGINELELVDGQQRISTIMLFLNAMKEKYKLLDMKKEADKLSNYLFCSDFNAEQNNKLVLGDLDSRDFNLIMGGRTLEKVINKRLLEAYNQISGLIENLPPQKLDDFKYKFTNQVNVIRLDVAESKDAFKLFETINNRGLNLSPADIIKNYLLGNASIADGNTLEEVKTDWSHLIISMDGLPLDEFFRQYVNGLLGRKVSFTLLIDTFKNYFLENVKTGDIPIEHTEYSPEVIEETEMSLVEDDNLSGETENNSTEPVLEKTPVKKMSINKFVAKLRKAADVYSKILNHNFSDTRVNRHMQNLQKIRSFASYTFILNLMQREIDINKKLEILKQIETFMLRRNIAEYRTAELDDIFSKLTTIKNDNIVETVKLTLKNHLPSDVEFKERFIQHDFKGQSENRAKYVLEQIEYELSGNTGEKYLGSGDEVHLEHIIPQTITTKKSKEEYGDWEKYLGEEGTKMHRTMVPKIGNLTLLAAPLNIKASNNPFLAKKQEYAKSDIKITKHLLRFDEFKMLQIDKRSRDLAKKAVKIWSL